MVSGLIHPLKIRERVQYYASLKEPSSFDKGVAGAITGTFNRYLMLTDKDTSQAAERRRQVWGYIFTHDEFIPMEYHSSGLSPMDWNALYRWMGADWHEEKMRPQFKAELGWVWDCAQDAFKRVKINPALTMTEIIIRQFCEESL